MSQISVFDSNWIQGHRGLEGGNRNLGKRLEWIDRVKLDGKNKHKF